MSENIDGYEITVEAVKKVPEEQWLPSKLINVKKKKGKFGWLFEFSFRLLDEEYEGMIVTGQSGAKVNSNPNTKSNKWYSGLLGHELEEGESIKIKEFIDEKYEVFIEVKKGENRDFQNVTKVRKLKVKSNAKNPREDETTNEGEEFSIDNEPKTTKKEKKKPKRVQKKETLKEESNDDDASCDFDLSEEDIPF